MKAFVYKLEAPLKLKRFDEYNIKVEISKIILEKLRLEQEVATNILHIKTCQKAIYELSSGQFDVRVFDLNDRLIIALKNRNQELMVKLQAVTSSFDDKTKQLVKVKNEIKLLEKIKETKFQEFRKKYNVRVQKDMEDIYQILNQRKDEDRL